MSCRNLAATHWILNYEIQASRHSFKPWVKSGRRSATLSTYYYSSLCAHFKNHLENSPRKATFGLNFDHLCRDHQWLLWWMGSINLLRVFQEDEKRAKFFKIYRALRIVTLKDHPFAWIVGGKCDFQLYYYTESFLKKMKWQWFFSHN